MLGEMRESARESRTRSERGSDQRGQETLKPKHSLTQRERKEILYCTEHS